MNKGRPRTRDIGHPISSEANKLSVPDVDFGGSFGGKPMEEPKKLMASDRDTRQQDTDRRMRKYVEEDRIKKMMQEHPAFKADC